MLADGIEAMGDLSPGSVDMILCDMPYGTAGACFWDNTPPLDKLWAAYARAIKPNGAVVLFGQGMLSAQLMVSAPRSLPYRYSLVWEKNEVRGFLNAKRAPLRCHEDILVFYGRQPTYNPQMTQGHKPMNAAYRKPVEAGAYATGSKSTSTGGSTERYPKSVIKFDVINHHSPERVHPFQKPVPLLEYLIKTFTDPGDLVLDNCAGSGSTGRACLNTNRRFIGMEVHEPFYHQARAILGIAA